MVEKRGSPMKGRIRLPQFQTESVVVVDIEKVVWPFSRFQGNERQCCETQSSERMTAWVLWRKQATTTGIMKCIDKADKNKTAKLPRIINADLRYFRSDW